MTETFETFAPQASVIGAILLSPSLMGEAMQMIRGDDFTAVNCRTAWQAMTAMFREGIEIDPVMLRDRLTGFEGATAFISSCMELSPSVHNFGNHVAALKKQSMLFRLKELGAALADAADLDDALKLLSDGNDISIQRHARERRSMAQMLTSFGERHTGSPENFLRWHIKELNDGIHLRRGGYCIIGGRPSDGKTAFALEAALGQAKAGERVIFYSCEMVMEDIEDRILSSVAQINMDNMPGNKITEDEWQRYAEASADADISFEVVGASGMSVDDIRADALAHRATVIYVDYLQLLTPATRSRYGNRTEEVSQITRDLVLFAKRAGIALVALSQLSRPGTEDKNGRILPPTLSDLRESGQIEQDADVVMFIYREVRRGKAPRYLDIAKNRQGRLGKFSMDFDGKHQHFSNLTATERGASGMPKPKGQHASTPVLGKEEQQSFYEITGEDKNLPFN